MLEDFNGKAFEYEKLTQDEQERRGILGRLKGVISDFKTPTRNGRLYGPKLWENVFNDPLIKEKIENRCMFGELEHPQDRIDVDPEKIAVCLAEVPKKGPDGKLWGIFDILSTPCGKILKTLLDYGTTVGISSRGEGDIITSSNGIEEVDPDTYQCSCWDVVLVPAVKEARLQYVTESVQNGKTLKQALMEDLENSNEESQRVMKDTLHNLNIDLNEGIQYKGYDMTITQSGVQLRKSDGTLVMEFPTEEEAKEYVDNRVDAFNESLTYCGYDVSLTKSGVKLSHGDFSKEFSSLDDAVSFVQSNPLNESSIKDVYIEKENEKEEADNSGLDLVVELQEALQRSSDLEKVVKNLQEKLSVCYAKEKRSEGKLNSYKSSIKSLQESSKKSSSLESRISVLEEQLEASNKSSENKDKKIELLQEKFANIRSAHKEKVELAVSMIDELTKEVSSLKEELDTVRKSKSASISTLKESYSRKEDDLNAKMAELQKDSRLKVKQLTEKLEKVNSEADRYKEIARKAVDRYIVEKCQALGISSVDVKNKLGKSYSFNDINRICEDLSNSKIAIDKLPFKASRISNIKVKESAQDPVTKSLVISGVSIDSQFLNMVDRML